MVTTRGFGVEGRDLRVGLRWAKSLCHGLPPEVGCCQKIIRDKVYYRQGLPKLAWMEDQVRFKLVMEKDRAVNE